MNVKRYIAALGILAFFLHLAWENAQAPLYAGYQSFARHFPMCVRATAGDVVATLSVFAVVWLLKKDVPRTAVEYLALAIIGLVVAIAIERHALLAGAWYYAPAMPIIPWFRVGLAPVLQMTVLLPLVFYIADALLSNKETV